MKPSLFAAAAIALISCASACTAQPKTPQEARAFADRLIERAQAADVFENVTDDKSPRVRHRASGMECTFTGTRSESVELFAGSPRGDDVSCDVSLSMGILTQYAMRPASPRTVDAALAGYIAEIRKAHPDAKGLPDKPFPIRQAEMALPEWKTARFDLKMNGYPAYSRLAVAVSDGWVVEQRLTALPGETERADRVGEYAMFVVLRDMARFRRPGR